MPHDDLSSTAAGPGHVASTDQLGRLPTVARLYYTGQGSRRYKRASVRNGPGEALTFVSLAEERVRQAVALERERWRRQVSAVRSELAGLAGSDTSSGYKKWEAAALKLDALLKA